MKNLWKRHEESQEPIEYLYNQIFENTRLSYNSVYTHPGLNRSNLDMQRNMKKRTAMEIMVLSQLPTKTVKPLMDTRWLKLFLKGL